MNRAARKALEAENRKWPTRLRRVPPNEWPIDDDPGRVAVYRSRKYLVQVFWTTDSSLRLSVNRTTILPNGSWEDGLTWDELQQIKREIGYGDKWAIEIYPPDAHVVNVSNMRHLWILDEPPTVGWKRKGVK